MAVLFLCKEWSGICSFTISNFTWVRECFQSAPPDPCSVYGIILLVDGGLSFHRKIETGSWAVTKFINIQMEVVGPREQIKHRDLGFRLGNTAFVAHGGEFNPVDYKEEAAHLHVSIYIRNIECQYVEFTTFLWLSVDYILTKSES